MHRHGSGKLTAAEADRHGPLTRPPHCRAMASKTKLKLTRDIPLAECPLSLPSLQIWEPPAFAGLARNLAANSWQNNDLRQLETDLKVVQADASARERLLNGEAEKIDTWLIATQEYDAPAAKPRKVTKKKSKNDPDGEHEGYGEDEEDPEEAPPVEAPKAKTSDRVMVAKRKRKKKAKKKTDEGMEEEEEDEEAYEDHTTDHVAFWAMVDQQYCDPTKADLARLCAVRPLYPPLHPDDPDVKEPLKTLGLHYTEQWSAASKAAAAAAKADDEKAAGGRSHGTRGVDRSKGGDSMDWETARPPL